MKSIARFGIGLVALLAVGSAHAEKWQWTVAPALDFAFKKSDSTFTLLGSPWAVGWTGSPSYTSFVPSMAMSYGPIYGAISYDSPLENWNSTDADVTNGIYTTNSYSRKESTLTLGYRTPWSVNVFAGYVHGRSDQTSITYDANECTVLPCASPVSPAKYSFDERGPYLGVSYSHQFGDKGSLAATGAYGMMDGVMDLLSNNTIVDGRVSLYSKSPGYSFGLNWTGPLTGNMVYRAGFKMTNYIFKFDSASDGGPVFSVPKDRYRLEEVIYTFTIGVANYF
jgi:hypothetical protein